MKKRRIIYLAISLILVLAMSLSLMSCKPTDPTPTPSPSGTTAPTPTQTVTPTETQTTTPTTTPSEDPTPTETPTPSTGTLLDEDFWNWYSSGGSQSLPTIDYTEIASLTGDGDYFVAPISYDGDLAIENPDFTGTLTFNTVDVSGKFTINTPQSTVNLNGAMTVGDFMALTAENTLVINCTITITTADGKIHIKKGNVIIGENAVVQRTVNGSTVTIPVTIDFAAPMGPNYIITVKAKIDLITKNGRSFKIIVKTSDPVSITSDGNIIVDTTAIDTDAKTITVEHSGGSDIEVTEICVPGKSRINDDPKLKKIYECGVDFTTQAELQDVLDKCDKVALGADIALTSPLIITRNVTLDLNGHTISLATENTTFTTDQDYLIGVKRGGNLTIEDTSEEHDGKILGGSKACVKLTIKGEDALADKALGNFTESEEAQLVIKHGSLISEENFAISGNGTRHGTRILLDDEAGLIESKKYAAIYHPQSGNVEINGGTIKGVDSAMEVRAGVIEINGGTFTATATTFSVNSNTNGTTTTGAALAIAPHVSQKSLSVNINDGTFKAVVPISIANPENNPKPATDNVGLVMFNAPFTWSATASTQNTAAVVIGDNVIDRFEISASSINSNNLPTLSSDYKWASTGIPQQYILIVAQNYQAHLQNILDDGRIDKVTLDADIALTSPLIITRNVTLDLNGHTISLATENTTFTTDQDYLIGVKRGGNLTIDDSTEDHEGKILGGSKVCVKLTINGEDTLADKALGSFGGSEEAQLVINYGSLISNGNFAISGDATRHGTRLVISPDAGEIKSEASTAIYHPQLGYVKINGGTIKGVDSAMEVRAGVIEINGGTFTATATTFSVNSNTNGTTTTGAALAIAPRVSQKSISVNINDGSFKAVVPISIANPENNTKPAGDFAVAVMFNAPFTWSATASTQNTAAVVIGDNVYEVFKVTSFVQNSNDIFTLSSGYKWGGSGTDYELATNS